MEFVSAEQIATIAGVIGSLMVAIAYFLLILEKVKPMDIWYNVINLSAAILLSISLFYHFNLGSVIIEIFWISISLLGIYKKLKRNKSLDLN